MKRNCHDAPYDCPIEATMGMIGGKWKALILDQLYVTEGGVRFGELQKHMPKITPKMLTQQLRQLENDGLVIRRAYPEVPPKVEYELTEFGHTVLPLLEAMDSWGRMYLDNQGHAEE